MRWPRYKYAFCSLKFTTTEGFPECRCGMCDTTMSLTVLQLLNTIATKRSAQWQSGFIVWLNTWPQVVAAVRLLAFQL